MLRVSVQEPTPLRVIVAALEIVEPGFGVVIITSVAEGVDVHQPLSIGCRNVGRCSACFEKVIPPIAVPV